MSVSVSGYLEILPRKFGFLRKLDHNFRPSDEDTFVPGPIIYQNNLREGMFIEGLAEETAEKPKLATVEKVNGLPPAQAEFKKELRNLVSINPSDRLELRLSSDDIMGRILNFVTPIGRGQRGLIIAPPKTGKTTILKHLAQAVGQNHSGVRVYVILIDERPEEVTDFQRSLSKETVVLASSADESTANHLRMTRLAMGAAMREAEFGADVFVVIDSLTRMARAFNKDTESYGRTLSGGLGANALELPRRFFGAARKIENGGSLTIMATLLVDTGSLMDQVIFREFQGTGNLDLYLSAACAEQRIFPAININKSATRKEELLLTAQELKHTYKVRKLLSSFKQEEAMQHLIEQAEELLIF